MKYGVPYFLVLAGMMIAIAAMFAPTLNDSNRALFAGVASTALGGAAGLARSPGSSVDVEKTDEVNVNK